MNTACASCLVAAREVCCPTEFAALDACASAHGCFDDTCLARDCGPELRAYDACGAMSYAAAAAAAADGGVGACFNRLFGCLGDTYLDPPLCDRLP